MYLTPLLTTPRVRRYILILAILLSIVCWFGWNTSMLSRHLEGAARSVQTPKSSNDWKGVEGLIQVKVKTLDRALLPARKRRKIPYPSTRRLIIIGDVHGCKAQLDQLLGKVIFNVNKDHLIFAGDLINKGPDSLAVMELARGYTASCVRGNHEDRILNLRHEMSASGTLEKPLGADSEQSSSSILLSTQERERELARSLSEEQVQWLQSCAVILNVGQIAGIGHVVVVHGGLVPGVDLEKQDPYAVMNMRTINVDTNEPSPSKRGTPWSKVFNEYQYRLYSQYSKWKWPWTNVESRTTTVVYSHDSASSFAPRQYTRGIGTGCVKGGKLTAMVIDDGGEETIVQVPCYDPDLE